MAARMVKPHVVTRELTESVFYPAHDPRTESREYRWVHRRLIYELDEPCWICGVRRSDGAAMETHHWHVEWALCNRIDPARIIADFPDMGAADDAHLRHWLDSEGNMLVLCEAHHRHGLVGIHSITYPAWVAQRWLLGDGHDISAAP
jgi:hypothetical protein